MGDQPKVRGAAMPGAQERRGAHRLPSALPSTAWKSAAFEPAKAPSAKAPSAKQRRAPSVGGPDRSETPETPRTAATNKLLQGKMLSEGEMALLREAAAGGEAAGEAAGCYHRPLSDDGAPLASEEAATAPPSLPPGEQYELRVPAGYVGGDELPVRLDDGREVVVMVPEGLGPGAEFIALIPAGA